ncbi:MAG: tRNA (cytidine(34)-2'-O)-methyltransferase [Solobacterium sp.]|nr:tRNA (cytidine(34)-2'-O)-methyltransferase [Solobacterium sp.]
MRLNVVLYEPEIPQNTGNIMRTCTVWNARLHLIEPLGFSLDEKHLRRAGMDYIGSLDYTVYPDWQTFLQKNPDGEFYYATRYGHKAPDAFDYTGADGELYLVFGKESTGIPKDILREHIDRCIRIPMRGEFRSLNLSNCVAVCMYEVLRQTGYTDLSREEQIKGSHVLDQAIK